MSRTLGTDEIDSLKRAKDHELRSVLSTVTPLRRGNPTGATAANAGSPPSVGSVSPEQTAELVHALAGIDQLYSSVLDVPASGGGGVHSGADADGGTKAPTTVYDDLLHFSVREVRMGAAWRPFSPL